MHASSVAREPSPMTTAAQFHRYSRHTYHTRTITRLGLPHTHATPVPGSHSMGLLCFKQQAPSVTRDPTTGDAAHSRFLNHIPQRSCSSGPRRPPPDEALGPEFHGPAIQPATCVWLDPKTDKRKPSPHQASGPHPAPPTWPHKSSFGEAATRA